MYVLIFIAFHQCNLNGAPKLCTKLKWENIQRSASSVWNDTLEQKKNDLWGWGKQQQIRGLLHYYLPRGPLPQSRGTLFKRAGPWFFFPRHAHMVWARQSLLHDTLSRSAQCKDMFLAQAQMQHPEVWPCPPSNLPPETPDAWTWYLA